MFQESNQNKEMSERTLAIPNDVSALMKDVAGNIGPTCLARRTGDIVVPEMASLSLPVVAQRSVSIEIIAPALQAKRLAEAEAEKRRRERQARRELRRRVRMQWASGEATFSSD